MCQYNQLLVFILDEQRYALHLPVVDRVVRMVEITPIPQAPEIVLGMIDVQGLVIPVVSIRKRFGLSEREIHPDDRLIIANTSRRTVALAVDAVSGIVEGQRQEMVMADEILPDMTYIEGVLKLEDGMILIHNLDKFLSLEEEKRLNNVIERMMTELGEKG